MLPMQKDIEWGYLIPYMVTGMLNEHPRAGIEMRKTADKDKYAKFYEEIRDVVRLKDVADYRRTIK